MRIANLGSHCASTQEERTSTSGCRLQRPKCSLKDDFPLPISELIIDGNSGFFSHLIHGQKFWVKSNAPGRRRATAKITQKGAKEGECWFSGCACVGPGGPGSSRIKSSRSPGTMVDWCEEEYSSEEELDSDEEEDCPTIRVSVEDKTKEG